MAAFLSGGGPGRNGSRRGYKPMSDINVTPMVDVMLVLLIVFMVAAPLLTVGVPVDLPKTPAASINDRVEPLTITIDNGGRIFLQEAEATMDQLVPRLQAITRSKPDTTIFVRGDKGIAYGKIMEVMGLVASAGFAKVSLIAEMPSSSGAPRPGTTRQPAPQR
jgi:biopolymer transport protein TolR